MTTAPHPFLEPAPSPLKLSLIVPIYNEERNIEQALRNLVEAPCPIDREWIIIDDGSHDGSPRILEALQKELSFKLIRLPSNLGKGAAVVRGLQEVTGHFVMIHDADFEYDPKDIPQLLVPLLENRADAVYGSRFKKTSPQVHRTYHYFINNTLTILSNLLSGVYLSDMETCYKLFRSDLVKAMRLRSQRFGIEIELTAYLAKTKARIFELPIQYYPRTRLDGKKIGWKDGVAALFHLLRFNWFTPFEKSFHSLPSRYRPQ